MRGAAPALRAAARLPRISSRLSENLLTCLAAVTGTILRLEELERRLAPAGVNNFTFANVDGGTVTVHRSQPLLTSTNEANVGFIQATGINLGTVTVQGDLGAIDAGNTKGIAAYSRSAIVPPANGQDSVGGWSGGVRPDRI